MCVRVVSSDSLHRPYRTPEDRSREVIFITPDDAGTVALSVDSEGKQAGGLYAITNVRHTIEGVRPADLGSDLSYVALTSETGSVRVSRWCVVHVVLSCHPG